MHLNSLCYHFYHRTNQELSDLLGVALKKAQRADKDIDISTNAKSYKQAMESLTVAISACVGPDLLPQTADVASAARDLEASMRAKLTGTMLRRAIATAEETRESAPLAEWLDKVTSDELLRESCADAVKSAQTVLATLRAEEKNRQVFAYTRWCSLLLCLRFTFEIKILQLQTWPVFLPDFSSTLTCFVK